MCVRNPLTQNQLFAGFSGETHRKHNNSGFTFIVLFHLFQAVMKPWQPVFGQWRQTLSAFCLFYFYFFWHPGLADICHRPDNEFLISSMKEAGRAFCGMWTRGTAQTG